MGLLLSKADVRKILREELAPLRQQLTTITEQQTKIMSAISDYTARVDAHLDKLDKGIKGLGDDIQFLKKKIEELQNSPGPISPGDQALLDALEARVKVAAEKAEALDSQTEQAPEPPPAG